MLNNKKPIIIGICGLSGSGKSTLCKQIEDHFSDKNVLTISTENYYKQLLPKTISPVSSKVYPDFNSPDSIYIETLKQHLLDETNKQEVDLILLQGNNIFYFDEIREMLDLKIFIEADADVRLYRRMQRNIELYHHTMEDAAEYFLDMAKYNESKFFEQTKIFADILLNGTNISKIAIAMIIDYIKSLQ